MTILGLAILAISALVAIDYAVHARAIRQRDATISRLVARSVALERKATGHATWRAGL